MADTDTAANKAKNGGKKYSKKEQRARAEKARLKAVRDGRSSAAATAATDPHSSSPLTNGHVTGPSPPSDVAAPVAHSSRGRNRKRKRTSPAPAAQEASAPPSASASSLPSADASSKPTDTPGKLQRRRYDAIRGGLLKGSAAEQADMIYDILTDPSFEAARRLLDARLRKSKEASAESAVLDLSQEDDSGVRSPSSDTSPAPGEEARPRQPQTAVSTDSSTTPQRTAHPSVTPRYGGRPVDLTKAAVSTPVDESAFDMNRASGKKRKSETARRYKNLMVQQIVDAIDSVGDFEQQRLALRDALGHPKIRKVASSLGFDVESKEVAAHFLSQTSKLISSISGQKSNRGRGNASSQAMLNAAATLAASSPSKEGEQAPAAPSMTKVSRVLGFTKETGRRKLTEGSKRRKLIHDGEEFELVKQKEGYKKVSDEIRKGMVEWALHDNQYIKPSPNGNDLLVVKDLKGERVFNDDGTLKKATKYILTIPWRELYITMLKKAAEGGYERAWVDGEVGGKVLIAMTMMRYLMPNNVVRMTSRYVSICGCEYCIIIAAMHNSLLIWRVREVKRLEKAVSEMPEGDEKDAKKADVMSYKEQVMEVDDSTGKWKSKTERAADVLPEITCPNVDGFDYAPWSCYHGKCGCDHELDVNSQEEDEAGSRIQFWVFVGKYECTYHGLLDGTTCHECEGLNEDEIEAQKKKLGRTKPPKVKYEKKRIEMSLPIGMFMKSYYIPQLIIYKRHLAYVRMLGKNGCAARRLEKGSVDGTVYCRADYAERFDPSGHDGEIMSEGFGGGGNVSLEGRTARFVDADGNVRFIFNCCVSDDKSQNAATTKMNMVQMIDDMIERGDVKRESLRRFMDDTDGCYKQYFCANAYQRLSEIAVMFGIIVDRAIAAPGHGKNEVDGLNGIVKTLLRHYFSCRTQSPMDEDNDRKVAVHKIAAGDNNQCIEIGRECHRILSKSHTDLVELPAAHKKLLESRKVDENRFHYREEGTINQEMQMEAKGFAKGDGTSKNYNVLGDSDLGFGVAAVRLIPCPCNGCDERLKRAWDPKIDDPKKQPRYCGDCNECELWPIFKGLNNWKIIRLQKKVTKKNDGSATTVALQEAWDMTLVGIGKLFSESVQVGRIGAMVYDGEDEPYRPIMWEGLPFELDKDTYFDEEESNPPVQAKKGEYVCRATYYDPLEGASGWYWKTEDKIVVRMRYVLATDVALLDPSDEVKLPTNMRRAHRTFAATKIIKKINNDTDDYLIDEAKRRECHDFDEHAEDFDVESEDEGSEEEGGGGDGDDGDEMNGDDASSDDDSMIE